MRWIEWKGLAPTARALGCDRSVIASLISGTARAGTIALVATSLPRLLAELEAQERDAIGRRGHRG